MIQSPHRRNDLFPVVHAVSRRLTLGLAALLVCATSIVSSPSIAADIDADNTKRNQEDSSALTPMDQSNDPRDIKIVAAIRGAITDDSTLSTNAQNLKVVVRQGAVTLRGPVNNMSEKSRIEQIAKNTQGVVRVDSQINVKH